MVDPWAIAAAALFRAPGSADASYTPPAGASVPCRAIRSTAPDDMVVGNRTFAANATLIDLQCSDFDQTGVAPVKGGVVTIGGSAWRLSAKPRLDVEGVSWRCEAEPA